MLATHAAGPTYARSEHAYRATYADRPVLQYMNTYLQFPPPKHQPPVPLNKDYDYWCDPTVPAYNAIVRKNPCFVSNLLQLMSARPTESLTNRKPGCQNIYNIIDQCPYRSDQVARYYGPYFNHKVVKEAIHAPLDVRWTQCSRKNVFVHRDKSPDAIQEALPKGKLLQSMLH